MISIFVIFVARFLGIKWGIQLRASSDDEKALTQWVLIYSN